jgi:hypothetical protein
MLPATTVADSDKSESLRELRLPLPFLRACSPNAPLRSDCISLKPLLSLRLDGFVSLVGVGAGEKEEEEEERVESRWTSIELVARVIVRVSGLSDCPMRV